MDDNKPSGQFPLPGVALVLVLLGVLVFTESPFKPTRPEAQVDMTSRPEDVLARLWQDPFDAVEKHKKKMHPTTDELQIARLDSDLYNNSQYIDVYHRVCNYWGSKDKMEFADFQRDLENQSAEHKDVKAIYRKLSKGLWASILNGAHTSAELRCRIERDIDKSKTAENDLQILAMMIPGGKYAEDQETRIRSRYALITALSNAGYVPVDAKHIGYLDFADLCKKSLKGLPVDSKYCDWPAIVPYERFELSEQHDGGTDNKHADNILVMWLNEEALAYGKPLKLLEDVVDELRPTAHEVNGEFEHRESKGAKKNLTIKHDVIGPASSTTLLAMYKEIYQAACSGKAKDCDASKAWEYFSPEIRIISPRATMEDKAINKLLLLDKDFSFEPMLTVERAIVDDEMLVRELVCELMRRGVNPYEYKEKGSPHVGNCRQVSHDMNQGGKQDHIILVGEWDTLYSRNFNNLFREVIGEGDCDKEIGWLHSYNYFRGIDGTSSSEEKQKSASRDSSADTNKKSEPLRRAIGPNQFDYLRRMGDQIEELSASLEGKGNIRAIGIVGSDTYDKLLVLQALRGRFPNVIFFTTDLDARMLHDEENEWARNLVVASGYGLSPDEATYRGVPFRDSYQTALYVAVKHAVLVDSELPLVNPVRLFEVGNRGAVDYSQTSESKDEHELQGGKSGFIGTYWAYLLALAALFVFLVAQSSRNSRRVVVVTAISVLVVSLWLAVLNTTDSLEFHAMLSGTSVWPAIIIRMIAAVLALIFIAYILDSLRKNNSLLIRKYQLPFEDSERLYDRIVKRFRTFSISDNKMVKTINVVWEEIVGSFKTMRASRYYSERTIEKYQFEEPSIWAHLLISVWGWRYKVGRKVRIEHLMYQYLEMGRTKRWLTRVLIMYVLYFFIIVTFMKTNPTFIFTPYSGEISAWASKFVLLTCVLGYLFLVFLVVDVTRLYAQFVDLLSRCNVIWPKKLIKRYCDDYGVSEKVAGEKLKLDLVVQRSKVVDVMIFLPFIVLSLLILSRSSFFDRWHMPIHLAIVILLGAMIALSSAIRLRRAANKARQHALERLEDMYCMQVYRESVYKVDGKTKPRPVQLDMSKRIRIIIDNIHSIKEGPFLPITRHPIVTAIAMPFGGVGGLYLIDYIATMGL